MKHIELLLGKFEVSYENYLDYPEETGEKDLDAAREAIIEYVDELVNQIAALDNKVENLRAELRKKEEN